MLTIIFLAAVGFGLWRFSYWPFDGTIKMVPKYGETRGTKSGS